MLLGLVMTTRGWIWRANLPPVYRASWVELVGEKDRSESPSVECDSARRPGAQCDKISSCWWRTLFVARKLSGRIADTN